VYEARRTSRTWLRELLQKQGSAREATESGTYIKNLNWKLHGPYLRIFYVHKLYEIHSIPKSCLTFRNKLRLRWVAVLLHVQPLQSGWTSLVGCPRLLIHTIQATVYNWRQFLLCVTWGRAKATGASDPIVRGWRKLQNKTPLRVYASWNIIRKMKWKSVRWTWRVARIYM
jgi:hypothetical protein